MTAAGYICTLRRLKNVPMPRAYSATRLLPHLSSTFPIPRALFENKGGVKCQMY